MAQSAAAQGAFVPPAEQIAAGSAFSAPKVGDYGDLLKRQPDLMGTWVYTSPDTEVQSTIFDPANAVIPFKLPRGEMEFGPRPGTYIKNIPYKPEYQARYMALVKATTEGATEDTFALCNSYGMPRLMGGAAAAFDIVQSPEVIIAFNPYSRDSRRIFLDGRHHPSATGPEGVDARTVTGHSVGHWEGETLVIETVNMVGGYYDATPAPYSNQISLVERIRLIDTHTLENQMTITDPVMLSRSWKVTRYYLRTASELGPGMAMQSGQRIVHRFFDLLDQPCVPNIEIKNGVQRMILPQELEAEQEQSERSQPERSPR